MQYEFVRPRPDGTMPKAPDLAGNWVPILDVNEAGPAAQATCAFYLDLGLQLGALVNERHHRWAEVAQRAAENVRRVAASPPRDELEELRGNPAKAERIRQQWRDSGLRGGAA